MSSIIKKRICFFIILTLSFIFIPGIYTHEVFAQGKKIILATDPWPPYYGPNMKNGGYFTEIAKASFKKIGYECDVKFIPWKRAFDVSKAGGYDGLLGAFYKEGRTEYFKYSDPISETSIVFFSKKGRKITFKEMKDLSQYKIGVITGYNYSKAFDTAAYLHKEGVPNLKLNIKKLMAGRIDIFIESREVALWTLREEIPNYADLVEIVNPPLKINKLYIPISKKIKNHEQIVAAFNTGLKLIKEDGTFDKIKKFHGF